MDHLHGDAEELVRLAGTHKLVAGAGMLTSADARPWLMLALVGAAFDAASLAAKHAKPAAFVTLGALALVDAALLWALSRGTRTEEH